MCTLTKEKTLPLLCYDIVFKSIFINQENTLAKMISDITGIDYHLLENNITLETNEIPIKRKNEKAKRCDFIARIHKDNIVNLELNRQSHTGYIVKNLSYIFEKFATTASKGESYNENLKVMQINLNCFHDNSLKPLSKYLLKEDSNDTIYTDTLVIYQLNVVKCHEIFYNNDEIPNYIKWGTLIYCANIQEIPKIVEGIMSKEERNQIMDHLEKLENDKHVMSEIEALKWDDWERNTIYQDGIKIGIEQGIEQGIEKTILNMLKNKLDYATISKITKKSIDEIKKIERAV